MYRRQVLALLPSLAIGASGIARAQGVPELHHAVIALSTSEALLALAAQIKSQVEDDDAKLDWRISYTATTWQVRCFGSTRVGPVKASLLGTLRGKEGRDDLLVAYSGAGELGGDSKRKAEPFIVHGTVDWPYDKQRGDYFTTDFRHLTKFGENSTWKWIVGGEILVGSAVGIAGGIGATALVVGTGALGLLAWIAAAGASGTAAIGAASGLISISESVQKHFTGNSPVGAPDLPKRPEVPSQEKPFEWRDGKILVAIDRQGRIVGRGPTASNGIQGTFSKERGDGQGLVARS